jgi:hypothetical protein
MNDIVQYRPDQLQFFHFIMATIASNNIHGPQSVLDLSGVKREDVNPFVDNLSFSGLRPASGNTAESSIGNQNGNNSSPCWEPPQPSPCDQPPQLLPSPGYKPYMVLMGTFCALFASFGWRSGKCVSNNSGKLAPSPIPVSFCSRGVY